MAEFKTAAVLGAGVMGSGIAAHLAGAGIRVLLLDIVPPTGDRNAFAQGGKDKALRAKPAAFFTPRDADLIRVGNLEDDLAAAAKLDLVIEVVKEDLAVKRALFAKLDPLLAEHTIVTSNTSGLPIEKMMEGRSASMKRRFLVTHFFNPVRYMKLLELVAGQETDAAILEKVARFGRDVLGKGIVYGKDTPNFVANRVGVFAMMYLIHLAIEGGYTVEEVDAIFGPPLGRPKSAVFRTADVVGLDTIIHVAQNCYEALTHDEARETFKVPALLSQMADKKLLGDKTGGGFMKKTPQGIVTLDLTTLEYRPQQKAKLASVGATKGVADVGERIRTMLGGPPSDRGVALARKVTFATLAYAAHRVGEIADDLVNIDRGMRWGFGWDVGPFETWDAVGVEAGLQAMEQQGLRAPAWVGEMLKAGRKSFYAEGTYWDVTKRTATPIPTSHKELYLPRSKGGVLWKNDGATLHDIGDRIACLELHTKMNAIDADVILALHQSVDIAEEKCDGLVVGNHDALAFSAGANIFLVLLGAQQGNWKQLEEMIRGLQGGLSRLRYASVPTVTAPFGLALGGGAELAMHGAASRASCELYMGLVEAGVGLVPAGGGCKELLARHLDQYPDDADPFVMVKKLFMQIALGKVSMSAEEARAMGMLSPSDGVTLNRDFLLHDAKQTALGLFRAGYRPQRPRTMRLPGPSGYATLRSTLQMMHEAHQISAHDVVVGSKLAYVLTGGKTAPTIRVTEEHVLDLEREAFLSLLGEEKTRERMQHMLMNNKPLRN